jgi:hypothetical protein
MREKQFLCACEEQGFRHTRGREQSERWRENKWISTPAKIKSLFSQSKYLKSKKNGKDEKCFEQRLTVFLCKDVVTPCPVLQKRQ